MTHTVVGFFDQESSAQNAVLRLVDTGVARDHIDVANSTAGRADNTSDKKEEEGFFDKVGTFFQSLFEDETQAEKYSSFAHQKTIVTVHAQSYEEAVHAAQILDEGGAMDADTSRSHHDPERVSDRSLPINDDKLEDYGGIGTSGMRTRSRIFNRPVFQDYRLLGTSNYEEDLNRDTRSRSRNY